MKTNVFMFYLLTIITFGIYAVWHKVRFTNEMLDRMDRLDSRIDTLMAK